MSIAMPLKIQVEEATRQRMDKAFAAGDYRGWLVQSGEPKKVKPLSRCRREDLMGAADLIINPTVWLDFSEWRNPTIKQFVESASSLTLGEWLEGEKQKGSVAG